MFRQRHLRALVLNRYTSLPMSPATQSEAAVSLLHPLDYGKVGAEASRGGKQQTSICDRLPVDDSALYPVLNRTVSRSLRDLSCDDSVCNYAFCSLAALAAFIAGSR